jgi:hypothetical protein
VAEPVCKHGESTTAEFQTTRDKQTYVSAFSLNHCWCCGCGLGPDDFDGICPACDTEET